jgi:putative Holliday junction resolvase
MRYLGVDLGERRIGLALSDPMGIVAKPLGVVDRARSRDAIQAVAETARERGVDAVVVGLPRHMNGGEGAGAEKARAFARALGETLGAEVHLQDERLSTVAAERVLIERRVRREKRRNMVDPTAAAIILQGYLDAHRESSPGNGQG